MRAFEKKTPPSIDRVIESKNKSTDFKKDSNDLSKS